VVRSVLEALSYCHSLGVMHRDIKPEVGTRAGALCGPRWSSFSKPAACLSHPGAQVLPAPSCFSDCHVVPARRYCGALWPPGALASIVLPLSASAILSSAVEPHVVPVAWPVEQQMCSATATSCHHAVSMVPSLCFSDCHRLGRRSVAQQGNRASRSNTWCLLHVFVQQAVRHVTLCACAQAVAAPATPLRPPEHHV
jgi:hypothetical protein